MSKKIKFTPQCDSEELANTVFELWFNATSEDYGLQAMIKGYNRNQLIKIKEAIVIEIAKKG